MPHVDSPAARPSRQRIALVQQGGGNADTHPTGIGSNIVNPVRRGAAEFADLEVSTCTGPGSPFGRNS
jgi:hypothetical protein